MRPTTIRKPVSGGLIHGLNRSVRGAHRDAQVDDLLLARDLNRVVLREDFIAGADVKAIADTATSAVTRQGLRVFGQGIAETDSGLILVSGDLGQNLITTNEAAHTAAVGTQVFLQPDTHGPFRLSVLMKMPAIDDAAAFVGFCGSAADALDPRVTGATTTITLVDDDLVGAYFDSGLTAADRWFSPSNKSNAAATQTTASADIGKDLVAATLTLVTVVIDRDGNAVVEISDASGTSRKVVTGALDADEEHAAVFYVESNTTATKTMQLIATELEYYVEN